MYLITEFSKFSSKFSQFSRKSRREIKRTGNERTVSDVSELKRRSHCFRSNCQCQRVSVRSINRDLLISLLSFRNEPPAASLRRYAWAPAIPSVIQVNCNCARKNSLRRRKKIPEGRPRFSSSFPGSHGRA